ncbi:hypothetical protein ZIOFF_040807 [Zingiber officinale]|uniref:histidine kinase n=1 Tax=Zingiber officinale TaxID=94328 RepID=A0A8J5G3V1_ZINOF|nr:hypothetical protein ZIOFF_040807 [Zingiber officinale]
MVFAILLWAKLIKKYIIHYKDIFKQMLLLLGVSMFVLVFLIIQETKGDCNREEIITVVSLIKDHENQLLQIDTMMRGIAQTLTWEKNLSFLFTTQSKIVPQLYMAIMMQKWVAEISYVEPQGKVFSYYGQGNETYVLFSNDYDYLWCAQALNGIGKFSDEVTCSPPRHLNDSLFHNASYVGIGLQSIHMLFFNTPLGNSTNEVYIAAFLCEGGVSLLKKTRTIEGLLQAKLIKLKGAIQQAERKNMNKSLAFASTSHDIRTSLAGITGLVGICLADAPRVSELHSNMQQINTCVTKLLGILNSVLDISKIEAGKMQPEEVEFDICQVLEESTDIFHILGLNSLGDNYVGNLIESDPNHIEIIIEVDDIGVGIPKEKRTSIFENYVQVKESMNGGHEGTGLGLGIVQSFVRLLGGEIKIMHKTPTEKGTCFRFNILLKSCKPSDVNVDDESRAERSSSLPTNSIIIKDSANSQIVQSTISSMGFRKGLASDNIHAILFVQGDETTRIMQRWMEISGVEVWVIDHWRLIYSITEKIKNRLGCLGRSKSRSLASLLNTAAEFSHSKDEANKFLPLSNIEFKTSSKDYTSCVLIVIDFSHGNFPEIELTLKTLITGNESLHFKIVWLVNSNAPTDGLIPAIRFQLNHEV